jgi:DNA adenine methylase
MSPTLNRTQRLIINEMPPHNLFLEVFMGRKPIMRLKRRAQINIGVDCDPDVVAAAVDRYRDPGFTILRDDPIAFLRKYEWLHSQGGELVYCSPPRLGNTEQGPRESTEGFHEFLLETLKQLPCMVMITGIWSDLYERELSSWRTISYTDTGGMEEFVWMNFERPFELHDYRYFGDNHKERGQIKRKATRWRKRLEDMPLLERYALLHALRELKS